MISDRLFTRVTFLSFFLSLALLADLVRAASTLSLTIPTIPGDGPTNSIDIYSFSFGVSSPSSGGLPGRPNFSDLSVLKAVDSASAALMFTCASGTILNNVVLSYKDPLSFLGYSVTLCNVNVTSVQVAGSAGGGAPSESVSMSFQKIQWSYQKYDATGQPVGNPITKGWDLVAQTSWTDPCP